MSTQTQEVRDKIKTINKLEKEVADLKHYLFVINPMKQVKRGIGNDIQLYLKMETSRKFSITSSRWVGMGHHEAKIEIPDTLLEKYYHLAQEELKCKEQELQNLVMGKEATV